MGPPDEPDWYLREWAEHLGKRQADLVTELGWAKNSAHRIWHSKQPYRRDLVNQICTWLGIRPPELLMEPQEALALREIRQMAMKWAAEPDHPFVGADVTATPERRKAHT